MNASKVFKLKSADFIIEISPRELRDFWFPFRGILGLRIFQTYRN